jgi:SPP1 gp7 family putative phage head morphogenesis protein
LRVIAKAVMPPLMGEGWLEPATLVKETYQPTEGMKTAARRALRWKAEGKAKGAGTPVGWGRATDIVAGRAMSEDVVKRMYSFFSRHEVDKQGKDFDNVTNPSKGRIMWDAWGGDPGYTWSRTIVERLKSKDVKKGWRDSADKVPQHEYDIRLVDYYTPVLHDAIQAFIVSLPLEQLFAALSHRVQKDAERDLLFSQVRAMLGDSGNTKDLADALQQVLADGYMAGGHAAVRQLGASAVHMNTATGRAIMDHDWKHWIPGDTSAALKAADGGLRALLDTAGITVGGIANSVLDRIGNTVAAGLQAGLPTDAIGRAIREDVGNERRAEIIAQTESSRAVASATMETYAANGVTEWDLVISDTACDDCVLIEAGNPYPVGDDSNAPPVHPMCRCSLSPVVESIGEPAGEVGTGEPVGDLAPVEAAGEASTVGLADIADALSAFSPASYAALPALDFTDREVAETAFSYMGFGYRRINEYLRDNKITDVAEHLLERTIHEVETLTNALNQHSIEAPVTVYRGQRTGGSILTKEMLQDPSLAVGHRLSLDGFTSTTTEEGIKNNTLADFQGGLRLNLHLPAGTRGATINNPSECEFLLPPKTEITIVNAVKDAKGVLNVDAIVTAQG